MTKVKIIETTDELLIKHKDKFFSQKGMIKIQGTGLLNIILTMANGKNIIRIKPKSITIQTKSWFFNKISTIPTKDVIQIYTKEKRNSIDGTSNYTLHAKQVEGKETILLIRGVDIKDPKDAQLIEQKIENFLGLKDFQIQGEFRGELKKPLRVNTPLPQVKEQNPTQRTIKDLGVGSFLDYELVTWEVVYQTQYDWERKITEIQYQLTNHKDKSMLVFVQTYQKYPSIWLENKVSYRDLETYKLKEILYYPPTKLIFKDQLLFRKNTVTGKKFTPNKQEGLVIKQWHYITADEKQGLRILQYEDEDWVAFLGKKIEEFEFENILTY